MARLGAARQSAGQLTDQELMGKIQAGRRAALTQKNPGEYDPSSKEYQSKYGPLAGSSGDNENFMAGAGKSVVDLGRGLGQIGTDIGHGMGMVSDQTQATGQAGIDNSRERDAALMDTKAGLGGNISGTLATTLIPGAGAARGAEALNLGRTAMAARAFVNPNTYRAAAAAGATQGALQPVASDQSRLANAGVGALGGLGGTAAARGLGRLAQPITSGLSEASARAVDVLENAGVPLDLAQRTGSRFVGRMRNMAQDNPTTAGQQAAFKEVQGRGYNRAVLHTIGENADAATPEVLARADDRIGAVFDGVAERNPVDYDDALQARLSHIETEARNQLDDTQFGVVRRQLDNIVDKAADNGGRLDGRAYQSIRTGLNQLSMGADQTRGHVARQIREAMEDALERSANPQDLEALRHARIQYRRLKQIEPAVSTDEAGNISPSKLANTIGAKRNASQGKYGRGDQELVELAKAGKQILPEPTGNSGTAARVASQMMLPAMVGAAGGFGGDNGFDAGRALKFGLGAYAAPRAASRALLPNMASNYFAGGLGNPVARAMLQSPQNRAAIGGLLKQGSAVGALEAF